MINIDLSELLTEDLSRYALVIGVAKRAVEIIDEENEEFRHISENDRKMKTSDFSKLTYGTEKPVSLAVEELRNGEFRIVQPQTK